LLDQRINKECKLSCRDCWPTGVSSSTKRVGHFGRRKCIAVNLIKRSATTIYERARAISKCQMENNEHAMTSASSHNVFWISWSTRNTFCRTRYLSHCHAI